MAEAVAFMPLVQLEVSSALGAICRERAAQQVLALSLTMLRSKNLHFAHSSSFRTLGGDGPELRNALSCGFLPPEMDFTWVSLRRDAVRAEFPDFDVPGAFQVFNLTPGTLVDDGTPSSQRGGVTPWAGEPRKMSLERLAKVFQVDSEGLQ